MSFILLIYYWSVKIYVVVFLILCLLLLCSLMKYINSCSHFSNENFLYFLIFQFFSLSNFSLRTLCTWSKTWWMLKGWGKKLPSWFFDYFIKTHTFIRNQTDCIVIVHFRYKMITKKHKIIQNKLLSCFSMKLENCLILVLV